ncbi:MAG: sensor domain-containing protein [Lysobacter sp.]
MAPDSAPLKILMVEDSPADADLVLRALRGLARPVESARVASAAALRQALVEFVPEVILSDFSMPGFNGPEALRICCEHAPGTPFLFVSGTIGEERAIEALQRGAADYVLKENLRRLPSAVMRALDLAFHRSERERVDQALRESEERFRSIVESSQDWIWENEVDTRLTYSNAAIARILGYQTGELLGTSTAEHMLPEDRQMVEQRMPGLLAAGRGWHKWRVRWRHRDGSIRVLESTAIPRRNSAGDIIGFRGVDQDITERLQQEARIQQLARIHAVLGALGTAVLRAADRDELLLNACQVAVDHGGFKAACIVIRNPGDDSIRLANSYGDSAVLAEVAPAEVIPINAASRYYSHPALRAFRGKRRTVVRDFVESDESAELRAEMARVGVAAQIALPIGADAWGLLVLYAGAPQEFDDEEIALLERLTGEIDYAVDFLAKSERLEFLAYNNPVSGLPNRTSFHAQLQPRLQREPLTVAVVDIERFAAINGSRGRAFGDLLLHQAGQRLCAVADADTLVAHLEADTFALAYRACGTPASELYRLDAVLQEFEREPFTVAGEEIRMHLRGGLAFAPDHGDDPESVEHNALAAMLEGSRHGLRVHAFNEELRGRAANRLALEHDLRRAIERKEFELYYQPKFEAATQRLAGAEALLRWRHPQRGLVSPGEFIPILEDSALIVPVGRWVMREALRTALIWREQHPGLRIAVNVSARELRHSHFLDECGALLQPYAGDPPIDIEITESLLMDDTDASMQLLDGLRELGCKVAIDDFGTGYSSLNYLARLPADTIKIDQSFIAVLTESPETMALVTHIIGLAHSLSLTVVAEGVEEEGQAQLLRLLRCDQLQGYLLGRPMPAAAFAERLLGLAPATT